MHDDIQIYDHAVLSPYARRLLVVLAAVAALVLGLMAPAHAADGHVVGTVTGEGTGPLAGMEVDVYDLNDGLDHVDSDETDAQGHYDVAVPPGTYLVVFYDWDEVYQPELFDNIKDFDIEAATPVVVTDGGSAQADAELTPVASISGHLTMTADDPEDAVRVYDDQNHVVGWGWVNPDGSYKVSGLEAGSYRLAFNRLSGFAFSAAEFYDDHAEGDGLAAADQVTLASGEARTGVDAVLVEGGHVTGTLQDSDGHPMHCRLQAFTTDRALVTRSGWSNATSGAFDITGLSTGSYLVRVVNGNDCQNGMQYVDADRGALSAALTAAAPVAATRGDDTALAPALVYDLGPVPTNVAPPTVSGAPVIGARLTANHGTWSPGTHLTYHYQWLAAGTPISGATHRTYTVSAGDAGKTLAVRVTVTRGSRTASATSAPTAPVSVPAGAPLVALSGPRVSGPAIVDGTLTVDPGTWSIPGATFSYRWTSGLQGRHRDRQPLAEGARERLQATAHAHRHGQPRGLRQRRGEHAGHLEGHAGQLAPDPPRRRSRARPSVGSTLKARAAKVDPKPRQLTYQWFRTARPFRARTPGATSSPLAMRGTGCTCS